MQQDDILGRKGSGPRIGVIGVGGAGGNAVTAMSRDGVSDVRLMAVNCDLQALVRCPVERIPIGARVTQGLGAGSHPQRGAAAADESIEAIERAVQNLDMCFVAAGMGGGTGTGAAPIVAATARRLGVLTIGVVTLPFAFEGNRRARLAEAGLEELERSVDALIVVPNQNLFRIIGQNTGLRSALSLADDVLAQSVRSIAEPLMLAGMKGLSFADIRGALAGMGRAMIGFGEGQYAPGRGLRAAERALSCPLLDAGVEGASKLIVSITGGSDMSLLEVQEAIECITECAAPDADILWSTSQDEALNGVVRVAVVATGAASSKAVIAPKRAQVAPSETSDARPAPMVPAVAKPAPLMMLDALAEAFEIDPIKTAPVVFTAVEAPGGELALTSEDRLFAPLPLSGQTAPVVEPLPENIAPSLLDRVGVAAIDAVRGWRVQPSHRARRSAPAQAGTARRRA